MNYAKLEAQDLRDLDFAKEIVYDCIVASWLQEGDKTLRLNLLKQFRERVGNARKACKDAREYQGDNRAHRMKLLSARDYAIRSVREFGRALSGDWEGQA